MMKKPSHIEDIDHIDHPQTHFKNPSKKTELKHPQYPQYPQYNQLNLNEIRRDPQIELLLTPVEDLPCPVCGAVCPNQIYCINCGHVKDRRLLELQAARVASLEDES